MKTSFWTRDLQIQVRHHPWFSRHHRGSGCPSVVSDSLRPPWTVAYQATPSIGFSRQEYWSGLPFPSPENLPYAGIEPGSPSLQADSLTSEQPGSWAKLFKPYFSCPMLIWNMLSL